MSRHTNYLGTGNHDLGSPGPDGLKQDREGRLYVAAGLNKPNPPFEPATDKKGGIYVLSPEGKLLTFLPVPTDEVTNCAFGGDDLKTEGDNFEVFTAPDTYEAVLEAVKKAGIKPSAAEVSMVPQNYIFLEGTPANQMIRLLDALEENDDVQNVYSNFDMDEKQMEQAVS